MPDQQLLIHFLIPAMVAGVLAAIGTLVAKSLLCGWLAGALAALLFPLAAFVGMFLQEGIQVPPGRDWHYIVWLAFAASVIGALLQFRTPWTPVPAGIAAAFAWLGCKYVLPNVGDDTQFDLVRNAWTIAIVVAVFVNAYLLRLVTILDGKRWSTWILVAQFGAVTAAMMSAYATLSAVALSYFAMALLLAVTASLTKVNSKHVEEKLLSEKQTELQLDGKEKARKVKQSDFLWQLAFQLPAIFIAALLVACFRNYNYAETASWTYGVLLFLPTIVSLIDVIFVRSYKPTIRVVVAGIVSSVLAGITLFVLFQSSGGESW